MKYTPLVITLCTTLAITSCDQQEATTEPANTPATETSQATPAGLEALIVDSEPSDAIGIFEAQDAAKAGEQITVTGKVMGRRDPFVEGTAMFILGDPNQITSCDQIAGDNCSMPWDVCCDDPEVIKQSVATIQAVDVNGKLIKQGFKGVAGITELSKLVVTGTVADGSNADNLIINATNIYVLP